MTQHNKNFQYRSAAQFLADVNLIEENATKYNGPNSPYVDAAKKVTEATRRLLMEQDEAVRKIEAELAEEANRPSPRARSLSVGSVGGQA